jgi:hypothetical protein
MKRGKRESATSICMVFGIEFHVAKWTQNILT